MNIFLIGYRCTGKSTIGRILAQILGRRFADADIEIEKENGAEIAEIVGRYGWEYFRQKEKETLVRVCKEDNQIIATGGGAVLDPENIRSMKKNGTVIWLKADAETVKSRMLGDEKTQSQRPALTGMDLADEIAENLAVRRPLYEKAADFSIDTDCVSTEEICGLIMEKIQQNR